MISADDLLFSFRSIADTAVKLASDVPDERFAEQPVEGINHPAWLFGHLSIYNCVIVSLLKGEPFDNPWDEPCGKNSQPEPDRSAYGSKEEILAGFQSGVDAAEQAIKSAAEEAWSAPVNHPEWGKQFSCVAAAVVYLTTTHLALHTGQLSGWRRTAKLPRI